MLLDIRDILLVKESLLQKASCAGSVVMLMKETRIVVERLLLCNYNILETSCGMASVENVAFIFLWLVQ